MKNRKLSAAIALCLGVVGVSGAAYADDQPITGTGSEFQLGEVKLTLGGFIEAAYIDRNRDEVADVGSKYAPIFPNNNAYYLTDNRFTARQSRLSLLLQGPDTDGGRGEAYYEGDFLGAAVTANSTESNSYTPRQRQLWAQYLWDGGFSILGGQAWSLVTQGTYNNGISPRKENVPLTIDAQYVPGFNWTRNPQFRFVEKFNDMFTLGASLESPAAIVSHSPATVYPTPSNTANTGTVVSTLPGGSLLNSTNNYSLESQPDIVIKGAFDPGWGHYEVFDLQRSFNDRVDPIVGTSTNVVGGTNHSASANSYGVNALLPIVPKTFDISASYMSGNAIGRYGSGQLPDFTFNSDGSIATLKGTDYLVGLLFHSTDWDLYAYDGQEKVNANFTNQVVGATTKFFGYGNPGNSNAGCTVTNPAGTCTGDVSKITQYTLGAWYKTYHGQGHMAIGLQYSHTNYDTFADSAGNAPSSDMNVIMVSFRYYMFN